MTRSQFLARHFRRVKGRPQAAQMKHGQPVKVSRVNFERASHGASITFGMWIKRVEWSPDRTSAKVSGLGFALEMWYDEEAVHAIDEVPSFAKLLVGPLGRFFQKTFQRQLSG